MSAYDTLRLAGRPSRRADGTDILRTFLAHNEGLWMTFGPFGERDIGADFRINAYRLPDPGNRGDNLLRFSGKGTVEEEKVAIESLKQVNIHRNGIARVHR